MSNLPAPGVYNVDPVHSTVSFVARHLVAAKVRGHFAEFLLASSPLVTASRIPASRHPCRPRVSRRTTRCATAT